MDDLIDSENTYIILEVIQTGDEITLDSYNDYILGRKKPNALQNANDFIPDEKIDIDLSPFQSYEAGVSRRHASLSFGQENVTITDLDSTNGTRLNGEVIQSFSPHNLHSGDFITLGKFKIRILIRTRIDNSTVEGGKS